MFIKLCFWKHFQKVLYWHPNLQMISKILDSNKSFSCVESHCWNCILQFFKMCDFPLCTTFTFNLCFISLQLYFITTLQMLHRMYCVKFYILCHSTLELREDWKMTLQARRHWDHFCHCDENEWMNTDDAMSTIQRSLSAVTIIKS